MLLITSYKRKMKKQSFWKTKAGGLTLAFIVIMIAFAVIMAGLGMSNDVLCMIGFITIVVAMLYSPVKVYILDRKKS